MAMTDKFNFYLNMYKTLNPGVGTGLNSLDGFLQFVKKRFPSFYSQAEAQVREIMKAAQPQSSGGGKKPPTKPPVNKTPEPPENPDKGKGTSGKPGAYKTTDSKQAGRAISNKRVDNLYKKPTSTEGLKEQYKNITNGAGKKFTPANPIPTNPREVSKSVTQFVDEGKGALNKVTGGMEKAKIPGAGGLNKFGGYILNTVSAVPATIDAFANWNAPGSDWKTRLLDFSAPIAIGGAPFLASRVPGAGKVLGTVKNVGIDTAGFATGAQAKAEAQNMRRSNVAGNETPYADYLADTQYDLSQVPDDVRAKYQQEMQYKAAHGGQGTVPTRVKTPNFTEGVEGSTLPADYESPEQFFKRVGIDSSTFNNDSNNKKVVDLPVITQPATTNVTSSTATAGNMNGNNGGSNTVMQSNNDNSDNTNFIDNVINRANNMTVDEARAGLQANQAQTAQPIPSGEQALIDQLMSREGYISPEQMRDLITEKYTSLRDINRQNPQYGGDYVQPGGYQLNEDAVRRLALADYLSGRTGDNAYANQYRNMQDMNYQAAMANRAGVPYEDYVNGMKERIKNDLILGQKEIENQLTNIAQQSTDMKTRLEAAQRIVLGRQQLEQKLAELEAQAKYTKDLEEMKQRYGILDRQMQNRNNLDVVLQQGQNAIDLEKIKQGDPNERAKALAYYYANTGLGLSGDRTAMARVTAMLDPELQRIMFGKVLDLDETIKMLNAINPQSNLSPSGFQQWLINNTNFMR